MRGDAATAPSWANKGSVEMTVLETTVDKQSAGFRVVAMLPAVGDK